MFKFNWTLPRAWMRMANEVLKNSRRARDICLPELRRQRQPLSNNTVWPITVAGKGFPFSMQKI